MTPDSPETLFPQVNLCVCLVYAEKFDEVELVLNRLDADIERLVGEDSRYFAKATLFHGLLNMARGGNRAAISYLQRGLGPMTANFPLDGLDVVQVQACLGLCLTRDGRAAEGEPLLRVAYEHGGKVNKAEFAHTIGNLESALGECLLAQRRYADAEPLLLTGLTDLEKRLGLQNRFTAQARQRLHDLYLAWNKPAEAARFGVKPMAQVNPP